MYKKLDFCCQVGTTCVVRTPERSFVNSRKHKSVVFPFSSALCRGLYTVLRFPEVEVPLDDTNETEVMVTVDLYHRCMYHLRAKETRTCVGVFA